MASMLYKIAAMGLVGAALVLSGCKPASVGAGGKDGVATSGTDCVTRTTAVWQAKDRAYTIDAFSDGPNCTQAVATLVIREPGGRPIVYEAYDASMVMVLAGQESKDAMTAALAQWITTDGPLETTADLPVWKDGADMPAAGEGEFPFLPDGDMDRQSYAEWRAQAAPMYCYIQGIESESCWVSVGEDLVKIGVRTFPG